MQASLDTTSVEDAPDARAMPLAFGDWGLGKIVMPGMLQDQRGGYRTRYVKVRNVLLRSITTLTSETVESELSVR